VAQSLPCRSGRNAQPSEAIPKVASTGAFRSTPFTRGSKWNDLPKIHYLFYHWKATSKQREPEAEIPPADTRIPAPSQKPSQGKNSSFEQWAECGRSLMEVEGSVQWWIGDWWAFGEGRHYGDGRELADEAGVEYQTIQDYGWVAANVEISRRREILSFSHHREVAPLTPELRAAIAGPWPAGNRDGFSWAVTEAAT
jgi:hypothetical protein